MCTPLSRLVSYELLRNVPSDKMRLIISSENLYFFRESPPDFHSLEVSVSLSHLLECRTAQGKTSKNGDDVCNE